MIKNYIKIAIRNLTKHKLTSLINLLGLTVGLTCCLLILIYILNELSYDRFNPGAENIYRVTRSFHNADGSQSLHLACVAPPVGPLLKNDFPDIKNVTQVLQNGTTVLRYKDKILNEQNVFYADNNLFSFFPVPLIKGNQANALQEPNSILMEEETAKKYFDGEDPVNKLVRVDNRNYFKVTGIFKSFPLNSHFRPQVLLSFNTLKDSAIYGERQLNTNWSNNSFYTYVMFQENYPARSMEAQFPAFLDKHMPFKNAPGAVKPSKRTFLHLQKLTAIHLHSALDCEMEANGDIKRVYIFSCIALFILLIACINYMNLSTARSVLRAREIGVRKAIGAKRKEIITQFLSESVLVTFISLAAAVLITVLILPYINMLSDLRLSTGSLLNPKIIAGLFLFPFIIGFISGAYPALFLSSFEPVKVLKGVFTVNKSNFSFRKILVVTQFSISIILIIATIVVFKQLSFMQNTALGFNKEHVIIANYSSAMDQKYESFQNNLLANPLVKEMSRSSRIPTGELLDDLGNVLVAEDDSMKVVSNADLKFVSVDYRYIPTFGIDLAAGRNFSGDFSTDSNNFIINVSGAKVLGWSNPQLAIGRNILYGGVKGKVIGVTKDFHFESMHKNIVPLLLRISRGSFFSLSFKVDGRHLHDAIAYVEKTWHGYLPETPFQYTFLDENVAQLYKSERHQSNIFTAFSLIAIFIACLGLFGLSAFTITQRIKEIGVRKVLGAGTGEIVRLLSTGFIKLVCVSALVAFPVAWYVMDQWLQDFAYHITIPLWAFAVSALLAVFIAFITISSQAIRAALSNPVKSLRTE